MITDKEAANEPQPTTAATRRPMVGRRLAAVATGAVMALGVGGVAYAATTDPAPSTTTTTPEDGTTTNPERGTTTTPDGRGPGGGEPCEEGAGTDGGTASSSDAA